MGAQKQVIGSVQELYYGQRGQVRLAVGMMPARYFKVVDVGRHPL